MTQYLCGGSIFDYIDSFTVDPADAGQNFEDAVDFKQSTQWDIHSHSTVTVQIVLTGAYDGQFIGLVGHNLGTEGIYITVESKALIGDSYSERLAATLIGDDFAKVLLFDSNASHKYWRLTFTGDNINSYITQLQIGSAISIENATAPITPPGLVSEREVVLGAGEKHYLGKKTRQKIIKQTIARAAIPVDVLEVYGLILSEATTWKPFFYVWDYENFPEECLYCWSSGIKSPIKYDTIKHGSYNFEFEGVR